MASGKQGGLGIFLLFLFLFGALAVLYVFFFGFDEKNPAPEGDGGSDSTLPLGDVGGLLPIDSVGETTVLPDDPSSFITNIISPDDGEIGVQGRDDRIILPPSTPGEWGESPSCATF